MKSRTGKAVFLLAALLAFFPLLIRDGNAGVSWQALIEEHRSMPERLIAVDKSRQRLYLFERRNPLRQTGLFTCTTGQVPGDKEREGDLKTPEGVYFVVQRIGSGLEFLKYGTEAYTLNYPNPVDRLRKKTGYGIWIHGRGEPLAPLQTQGCISLNNEDLASIGSRLKPGMPVALAESLSLILDKNSQEAASISLLEKKVQGWARAWGQRSASMFDFYDKEAYSIAQGEPFARFQGQKERLFRQLPWINNSIRDIRVLRGPGYWVTWFYQDYKAPNLSTSGVRRLYWVPDARGDFRIVGMEWAPGMGSGTLLASSEPALPPIEARPRTEEQAVPRPAGGSGEPASAEKAPPAAARVAPADPAGRASAITGRTAPPAGGEPARPPAPVARTDTPAPEKKTFADHVEDPRLGKMAEPPQAARLQAGRPQVGHPRTDAAASSTAPTLARGTLDLPPALPSQGLSASARPSGAAPSSAREPDGSAGSAGPTEPAARTEDPDSGAAGTDRQGTEPVRPPRTTAGLPGATTTEAKQAPSAEDIAGQLSDRTEAWRTAWESGNLDAYMTFYAPRARQGTRGSADAIRKHKLGLWGRAAPARLNLGDMRIQVRTPTVTVVMRQEYADSKGGGDRGLKTLIFEHINGQWLITQEKWSPLPDEADH